MNELVHKVAACESKKILMIGDIMLDEYLFGTVDRLSREAPVPIVKETGREWVCGGAANLVRNLQRAGCTVDVVGIIGKHDEAGRRLLELFAQNGIPTNGIISSEARQTTRKCRVMVQNQQLLRIDVQDELSLSDDDRRHMMVMIDSLMEPGKLILLSDYGSNMLDEALIKHVITKAAELCCLVISDPRGPTFEKYQGIDYLKPNLQEFKHMVDYFGFPRTDSLINNGVRMCTTLGLKGIIITLGAEGIQFVSPDHSLFSPAIKREVFDVSGAGDTVLAYLATGILSGLTFAESLKLANHAASVAVSRLKTYAVGLEDLVEASRADDRDKIVYHWAPLKEKLDAARALGKKVVFTNGCFDLLHSGHLYVFEEAKKCGDILVVALNSDDSITRLKGETRPIQPLSERARLIAALGVVDYVSVFTQNTATEFLQFLKPDVMVKGGDYKPETLPEYDMVTAFGGSVVIVNYQQGLSTTNIVGRIAAAQKADVAFAL